MSNPFDKFAETKTKTIDVKALGATVEIKTSLTIAEQEKIAEARFKHQITDGQGNVIINNADFLSSKILTVSLVLVEPKMNVYDLGQLVGAEKAIDEIYTAFSDEQIKKSDKGKKKS